MTLVFNLKYKPGEFNLRVEGSDRIVYSQHKNWCDIPYYKKILRGMFTLEEALMEAQAKEPLGEWPIDEKRIEYIGQNGNDGLIYKLRQGLVDEHKELDNDRG